MKIWTKVYVTTAVQLYEYSIATLALFLKRGCGDGGVRSATTKAAGVG
jgi:hypothetical protein